MSILLKNGYPDSMFSIDRAVQLCKDSDCSGKTYWVGVGEYREMPWYIGNNQLSHVKIPAHMYIKYYQHENFNEFSHHSRWSGWSHEHEISDRDTDFNMGGHNNAANSIKIEYSAFNIALDPNNILSIWEGDCDNDSQCDGGLLCW